MWNLLTTSKGLSGLLCCHALSRGCCRCRKTFGIVLFISSQTTCSNGFEKVTSRDIIVDLQVLNRFCRANNCHRVGYVSKKGRKKQIPPAPVSAGTMSFLKFGNDVDAIYWMSFGFLYSLWNILSDVPARQRT